MTERSDWQRLADVVRQRRQALDMNQDAVPGVGKATMSNIELAKQDSYKGFIVAALERAMKWETGSVSLVLAGGDPIEIDQPEPAGPDILELATELRHSLDKSKSRDDKLAAILSAATKAAGAIEGVAVEVGKNRELLVQIAEALGLEVDPELTPSR